MRRLIFTTAAILAAGAAFAAPTPSPGHIAGDYVEARTASVFAGACHYNGELTTTGRDAELAWHVKDGSWNGVSVSGLSAMAAVSSDDNLQSESAERRSVLYVDARATPDQKTALTSALEQTCGAALGHVVAVRSLPVHFARNGETYNVSASGACAMSVSAMPNHECCTQPNMVWYKPLVAITDRRVGFTRKSSVKDSAIDAEWTKNGQNTAFYGTFAL